MNPFIEFELPIVCPDVESAISHLGGKDKFDLSIKNESVKCSLRPEDPNHRPLSGTFEKSENQLLLRIQEDKSVTVLGPIERTYTFEKLADFQYLAPSDLLSQEKKSEQHWATCLQQTTAEFVPYHFSKVENPSLFEISKPQVSNSRVYKLHVINLTEDEPTPQEPMARIREVVEGSIEADAVHQLTQLFQEKPIWLRQRLTHDKIPDERRAIESQLPLFCYIPIGGPWRGCCIRLGYDPRTNVEAAMYQLVEVRIQDKKKRRSVDTERRRRRLTWESSKVDRGSNQQFSLFGIDNFDTKKFARFQLSDLVVDEEFKELFDSVPVRTQVDLNTGWYDAPFLELIRAMLRLRIIQVLQRENDIEATKAKVVICRQAMEAHYASTETKPNDLCVNETNSTTVEEVVV